MEWIGRVSDGVGRKWKGQSELKIEWPGGGEDRAGWGPSEQIMERIEDL